MSVRDEYYSSTCQQCNVNCCMGKIRRYVKEESLSKLQGAATDRSILYIFILFGK